MRQPDVAVAHCNKETKGHWLSLAALQNLSFLLVLFGQVMCKQRKLNIYSSTTEGQKGSADTCQDPCQASKDRHTSHSALSCRDVFAFRFRGLLQCLSLEECSAEASQRPPRKAQLPAAA